MLDSKISQKALDLVARAKAYNAQSDFCWHGRLGGIQGYDSQYGWPVGCYACEAEDNEPPFEPVEIYAWALATARGLPRPVVSWNEELDLD